MYVYVVLIFQCFLSISYHITGLLEPSRTPEALNHHLRAGIKTFSNSSELLAITCSHKNFMMISQTVQQLPC